MKHLLIISLFCLVAATGRAQQQPVTLDVSGTSVTELFRIVQEQTGLGFIYNVKDLSHLTPITAKAEAEPVGQFLERVLQGSGVGVEFSGTSIVLKAADGSTFVLRGTVTDQELGEPLPGANVRLSGDSSKGAVTDVDGHFSLTLPAGRTAELAVSYIGFTTRKVTVRSGQTDLAIVLSSADQSLTEVVKVGYFQRDRQTFTGAATSYSGEELRSISDRNVLSTLSALDPSFQIVQNISMGSDPNTVPNIQVRGMNSLPDASNTGGTSMGLDEQYKGSANLPTFILDGFEVSVEKVYDLDPNRIERISILKDASATAIYGSRAANGVVIIDTKNPTRGKLRLNYNGTLDVEVADLSQYNLLGAAEKLRYEQLAGLYNGSGSVYVQEDYLRDYNERLKLVSQGIDTDWLTKPLKQAGIGTKHTLQLEGGSDSFRYGINLNYNKTQGVMRGSDRQKLGTSLKFMYNYRNLRFQNELSYDNIDATNSPYGTFSAYAVMNPYYTPYDESGHLKPAAYVSSNAHAGAQYVANPLYNTTLSTIDSQGYNDFTDNFSLEWNATDRLKLKGTFSIEHINRQTDVFKPADHTDFLSTDTNRGSYFRAHTSSTSLDASAVLSYFGEWQYHALSLNGGWNVQQTSSDQDGYTVYGFPNQQLDHPSFGTTMPGGRALITGDALQTRLMGFLANAGYSWHDRYFADLSARMDGSSQFGSNQRWGLFWSTGAGWNIHHEPFMKRQKLVSQLRLRASTGYTGGQNFYPYQSMKMYQYSSDLAYQQYIGAILKSYGNDDLRWQRTQKNNFGIDFTLWHERISGYFNYYIENSKDLLVDINMMSYLGFDTYKENLGETQNKGCEFNLKVTALKTRNLRLNVYWNGQHYRNTLRRISSGLSSYNDRADATGSTAPYVRYVEGASINTIWVVPSLGIDPATGQEVFVRPDGSITNRWSQEDYVPYATTDPKLAGTFGLNLYWKSWELGLNFYYRCGGYAYNQTLVDKVENVNPYGNVDRRALYDRWQVAGQPARFKAINDLSQTRPTSRFVERDNLLTANSLSLAYTLPQKYVRRVGAEFCKVTLHANDFLYLSTMRREVGTAYPYSHHFSCSLQMAF